MANTTITAESIYLEKISNLIQENQALKETIATNEQYYSLQLEAVTNDRDHLKALLDRATDERYELHNSLIESRVGKAREIAQATEAITEILRNLN